MGLTFEWVPLPYLQWPIHLLPYALISHSHSKYFLGISFKMDTCDWT
jgi:hypothetical protein